jgi:hypothetical protein
MQARSVSEIPTLRPDYPLALIVRRCFQKFERLKIRMIFWKEFTKCGDLKTRGTALLEPEQRNTTEFDTVTLKDGADKRATRTIRGKSWRCIGTCQKVGITSDAGIRSAHNPDSQQLRLQGRVSGATRDMPEYRCFKLSRKLNSHVSLFAA